MKKSIKLKKIGLSAVTLILCLAVMITCVAFSLPFSHAFADDPSSSLLFDDSEHPIVETCDYGDTFTVPTAGSGVELTVKAPNGKNAEVKDGKVSANQVGNYTVTYKNDTAEYSFKVYVT